MKLYWNFLKDVPAQMYIATTEPKEIGDKVAFKSSVGYIERVGSGSWSAFLGNGSYIGNEPNKEYAMELVANHANSGGPQKPCSPTCQGHITHPCEKCGQQWGR